MKIRARRLDRRIASLLIFAAAVPLVGAGVSSASALVVCNAAVAVKITPDTTGTTTVASWTIAGEGTCPAGQGGTRTVEVAGSGISFDLGLCTTPTSPLMSALDVNMTIALTSLKTGATKTIKERWTANETTFPIVTQFLVVRRGSEVGAGALFTRIGGQCPPGGSASGTVIWVQQV